MSLGEINKGVVALIMVLLLAAGGYLWYSQMYTPAVAARTTALTAKTTAEQGLSAAKADLEAAQQRLEAAKVETSKVDDSLSRLAKARTGVPAEKLIDDAAIVLADMADRAGVDTRFNSEPESSSSRPAPTTGLQGATPIDIEFEAAGTYGEMMRFMRLAESTAEVEDGKLYSRGRLFNVVKLEIGETTEADDSQFTDPNADVNLETLGKPGDIHFTLTIRMYTSSTQNAQSVGGSTPDPAAAGSGATTSAPGADQGASPTPSADGSTPPASGTTPSGTGSTSSSTGTTPSGTGSTPTTGGTTPAGAGTSSASSPATAGAAAGGS